MSSDKKRSHEIQDGSKEQKKKKEQHKSLTNAIIGHANILLPFGEVLSDSVTVLRKYDLELGGAADSMDSIYGLNTLKRILKECIGLPLLCAQHYKINPRFIINIKNTVPGKRDLERTLAFYGQRGSGKILAVKTFCLENDLLMVLVIYAGFIADRDIKIAYEYAEKHMPCVVVFEECEGAFHPHNGYVDRNVGILQHWLDKIERSDAPIWTIFISVVEPSLENIHFAIRKFINYAGWSGELTPVERHKAFKAAINHYLYSGQESPLHETDITSYVDMSRHCTVGDIFTFVKKVFLYCLKDAAKELPMLSNRDERLIPTLEHFSLHIIRAGVGRDRITEFDPLTFNVAPYTNTAMDENNQDRYGF